MPLSVAWVLSANGLNEFSASGLGGIEINAGSGAIILTRSMTRLNLEKLSGKSATVNGS